MEVLADEVVTRLRRIPHVPCYKAAEPHEATLSMDEHLRIQLGVLESQVIVTIPLAACLKSPCWSMA